jgi:hypothetical protein
LAETVHVFQAQGLVTALTISTFASTREGNSMDSVSRKQAFRKRGFLFLSAAVLAFLVLHAPAARSQENMGGHIGFVLPLVTHAGGQTTTIADSFAIGFPMGVTFKGTGRMALDLEFVPSVQDVPRQVTLTIHPGLVWSVGHHIGVGARLAFNVNSSAVGFTPLVNKSWPIEGKFFKAYFVEADLPVRFNRPAAGPSTNPVTFAMHFGLGF